MDRFCCKVISWAMQWIVLSSQHIRVFKRKGQDVFESLRNKVGVLLIAGFEAKKEYIGGNEDNDEKPAAGETGKVFGITNVIRLTSPGPEGKDLVCGLEMSRALTTRVLWMDMDYLIRPLISREKAKEEM
jgi:hypothetical protein